MNTTSITKEIEISFLEKVQDLFVQANRKCKKLGFPEFSMEVGETSSFSKNDKTLNFVSVNITGPLLVIGGWKVAAHFDCEEEVVVNAIDRQPVDKKYRVRENAILCNHCGTKRNRHSTFLLKKDGREMVVGSTCVADFSCGSFSPESILAVADVWGAIEEIATEDPEGKGGGDWMGLDGYIANVWATCRAEKGFVSKAAAERSMAYAFVL